MSPNGAPVCKATTAQIFGDRHRAIRAYLSLDGSDREASTFRQGLRAHVAERTPARIVTMAAASFPGRRFQQELADLLELPVTIVDNTQFLVGRFNPIPEPEPGKRYVMESFYRAMRRHFDLLMDGEEPAGDQWTFDKQNRKPLPDDVEPPPRTM